MPRSIAQTQTSRSWQRWLMVGLAGYSSAAAVAGCSSKTAATSVVNEQGLQPDETDPGQPSPGLARVESGGLSFSTPEVDCGATTCTEQGWACGSMLDDCGNVIDCSAEGLGCKADEVCTGGINGPTVCSPAAVPCAACAAVPDCNAAAQLTRLTGRVVTPGRTDDDTGNQVGVPNAQVFISRSPNASDLPSIDAGIPDGGTSCQRCADEDLGPVLVGAVTDASGNYTLEGQIPVGQEFLLVVQIGKFRRAVPVTLPASAACQTTALPSTLPDNPTRLPRSQTDGQAVNLPRIAISTGQIDAMECVFEKLGISHDEFGNPGATATERIQLYRGGPDTGDPPGSGARIDDDTPHDSVLYGDLSRLEQYDLVVADCEGATWDADFSERDAFGDNVREYVNRGGRLFASHLSFSWLDGNGSATYDPNAAIATGLDAAGTWSTLVDTSDSGTGQISVGRPAASPHIDNFAAWMLNEGITSAASPTFPIIQPRSQSLSLGPASEEFVFLADGNQRVQQFSFNTPYAAPADQACGRVSYSGFHVSAGSGNAPFADAIFPDHCSGDLTDQEKVLLYMLFDLGACIGSTPVPPACVPVSCDGHCGLAQDGCGSVVDCGPCGGTPP
jgi:hypothetical protein